MNSIQNIILIINLYGMNETTIDISKSHDESIYMQYIAMALFIGGMYIVAMVYMRCCGNIPEEEISFENHRENNNITIEPA